MKSAKVMQKIGICLVLLVVAIVEVWIAWVLGSGKWYLPARVRLGLAAFVGVVFVPSVLTFIVGSTKGLMFGFILAICANSILAFFLYKYFLFGL